MLCDKCGKRIMDKTSENWQRFDIAETEYTLCQGCYEWLVMSIEGKIGKDE